MIEVMPFLMVIAIVAIVTWGKHNRAKMERGAASGGIEATQENARLRAEIARLSERVHVLERVVTDPGRRLADEIDELGRKR